LPGSTDAERKEFLADVSAIANTNGGDIIYGVREKRDVNGKATGLPAGADGIPVENLDQELRRLESMLISGIAPRLSGVHFKAVDGFDKGVVIVLRGRSLAAVVVAAAAPADALVPIGTV